VVVVLFGLPQVGIDIHWAGLAAIMTGWLVWSVVVYRIGSRALKRKPFDSLPDMVGGRGRVASPIAPEGLVRIKNELWMAKSARGALRLGEKVIVVEQDGLKLIVRRDRPGDTKKTK